MELASSSGGKTTFGILPSGKKLAHLKSFDTNASNEQLISEFSSIMRNK